MPEDDDATSAGETEVGIQPEPPTAVGAKPAPPETLVGPKPAPPAPMPPAPPVPPSFPRPISGAAPRISRPYPALDSRAAGPNPPPDSRNSQPYPALRAKAPALSQDDTPTVLPPPPPAPLEKSAEEQRYQLGDEFARGGLGRIVRALDKRLERPVAVKELLSQRGTTKDRFLREVLLTARLEHPSIVPVHDAGTWPSGAPFYTMKLISGRSLDEVIFERKSWRERVTLLPHVIDVCEAIAYAHSKRIIHRDIKPANVLIGEFGETIVIDWGLAKDLANSLPDIRDSQPAPALSQDEEAEHALKVLGVPSTTARAVSAGLTMDGAVLGTPAYMPPEQVNSQPVDERADVYALGALLYHVLAGRPPYEGGSSYEVLANVLLRRSTPLRQREPDLPPDLVAIVEKAMQAAPEQRYPSAKELAADLKKFQNGQLVSAHQYSNAERARRFLQKNRLALGVATAALGLLALVGALSVWRVVEARDIAQYERTAAIEAKGRVEARNNDLALLQAKSVLNQDPTAAIAWLKSMSTLGPGWEQARTIAVDAYGLGIANQVLYGPKAALTGGALSPDGAQVVAPSEDGTVWLFSTEDGHSQPLSGLQSKATQAAFSPDGAQIVATSQDGAVSLWSARCAPECAGRVLRAPSPAGTGSAQLAFSPDASWLAASAPDGTIDLWMLSKLDAPPRRLKNEATQINELAFSASGALASAGNDGAVYLWDVSSGTSRALRGHSGAIFDIAFAPNGTALASASEDKSVRLWDLSTGFSRPLSGHDDMVTHVTFSPDGKLVASGGDDRSVWLWETDSGRGRLLSGHKDAITWLCFSPEGKTLVSASRDQSVRRWDVSTGNSDTLLGHSGPVAWVGLPPSGALLASVSQDRSLRLWDLSSGISEKQAGHEDFVTDATFSPDGKYIASASVDHTSRLWDFVSGESRIVNVHEREVTQAKFSPDGSLIVTAGNDNTVRVYTIATGRSRILPGEQHAVRQIVFSPDGTRVAAASDDKTVHVWDLSTNTSLVLRGHLDTVLRVAFSPDGKTLASASQDQTLRLWDLSAGEGAASTVLRGHQGFVTWVAFSPDGKTLASASTDQHVRLWDIASGQSVALSGHQETVLQVAFSPDGQTLASASRDGVVYLWKLSTQAGRALTGHKGVVTQIVFSPDGQTLASAGRDRDIILWNVENGTPRYLKAHENWVNALSFSPDGKTLASASRDQSTILWDLSTGGYRILFCHQVYQDESRLPKKPEQLKKWLLERTTAVIGAENQAITPM
jgi:WD40 repeat protein/serine/threonine protein kinase